MVIFNFRADRVLELTKAFEEEDFQPFDRKRVPKVRLVLPCAQQLSFKIQLGMPRHSSDYD